MSRLLSVILILVCSASIASANTFTADGLTLEPSHGYTTLDDRALVNDGSFEAGRCLDGLSPWTCTSTNTCDWIVDLVPLGLWNYDGDHVVWLGGFCGGIATETTSVCQQLELNTQTGISWYWMAYVNDGGTQITVTIDGEVIYEHILATDEHLVDFQLAWADTDGVEGLHEVCFTYTNPGVEGDNYFIDFAEIALSPAPVDEVSFSTVKTIYRP